MITRIYRQTLRKPKEYSRILFAGSTENEKKQAKAI